MGIDVSAINTAGAVVTVGGVIPAATNPDADGFYWGSVSGTDIGCTTGGVTVSYSYEKNDIFCDQTLAAVDTAVSSETAEVSLTMLESDVEKLQYAIANSIYEADASEAKLAVGGVTALTFVLLKLEIADNDTSKLITWTFFKVLSNSIEINYERENPTGVQVTFTAYADTSHAVGHQLFSVHQDLTV
jgi:hypothetical protein